ncbi:chaperone protein clpb1 [Phtheirospermum japonicum]|uniref:Chaperone protein clpb1 n=1 Tax=Phtheirospermum japonicum TaxID=374723 RepID=A0A830BQZ2_9LAMI|nr:chaperone protein clpb1 [Phtheirospermum japonicum]
MLERACKLVLERFRNCAHEIELSEKAYELRRALVELTELYRDTDPNSQLWVDQVRSERDSSSIELQDFLQTWDYEIRPCGWFENWRVVDVFKGHASEIAGLGPNELSTLCQAVYRMNRRVVNQRHVVDQIFETLVSEKRINTCPRGLFFLLGRSGGGKSEIAKAVAEHWYCDATRLVEIDMSDYAEPQSESEAFDLSEWSNKKFQVLWNILAEIVAKRPYSVILLDKINKASSSITRDLVEVLSNNLASNDIERSLVDLSNSIIFMTSSVGSNHLSLACRRYNRSEEVRKEFKRDPWEFFKNHDGTLKYNGRERALAEARKFFGGDLLRIPGKAGSQATRLRAPTVLN